MVSWASTWIFEIRENTWWINMEFSFADGRNVQLVWLELLANYFWRSYLSNIILFLSNETADDNLTSKNITIETDNIEIHVPIRINWNTAQECFPNIVVVRESPHDWYVLKSFLIFFSCGWVLLLFENFVWGECCITLIIKVEWRQKFLYLGILLLPMF